MTPFPYSHTNKRYHTFDHFARSLFGQKAARVSLSAPFTCPNKDGRCGYGGCLFCAGGSSGALGDSIEEQYRQGAEVARHKWGDAALIPYLQANTNTYADTDTLRRLYLRCAALPGARMLAIGTRADCLGAEVVALLSEISRTIPLIVELGMQTVHDRTLSLIRRGYGHEEFLLGYRRLRAAGGNIRICLHLMNGLPGEDADDMLKTAEAAAALSPDMVKIHTTCVLRGTDLCTLWEQGAYTPLTMDGHVEILCDQLTVIPPEVVIARICADAPREILASPLWVRQKRAIENTLDKELRRRDIVQGCAR